jgi:hypothetical protein
VLSGLSIFFLAGVLNFIKTGQQTASLQHFLDLQDIGGGHLGKWLLTLAFVLHIHTITNWCSNIFSSDIVNQKLSATQHYVGSRVTIGGKRLKKFHFRLSIWTMIVVFISDLILVDLDIVIC